MENCRLNFFLGYGGGRDEFDRGYGGSRSYDDRDHYGGGRRGWEGGN